MLRDEHCAFQVFGHNLLVLSAAPSFRKSLPAPSPFTRRGSLLPVTFQCLNGSHLACSTILHRCPSFLLTGKRAQGADCGLHPFVSPLRIAYDHCSEYIHGVSECGAAGIQLMHPLESWGSGAPCGWACRSGRLLHGLWILLFGKILP